MASFLRSAMSIILAASLLLQLAHAKQLARQALITPAAKLAARQDGPMADPGASAYQLQCDTGNTACADGLGCCPSGVACSWTQYSNLVSSIPICAAPCDASSATCSGPYSHLCCAPGSTCDSMGMGSCAGTMFPMASGGFPMFSGGGFPFPTGGWPMPSGMPFFPKYPSGSDSAASASPGAGSGTTWITFQTPIPSVPSTGNPSGTNSSSSTGAAAASNGAASPRSSSPYMLGLIPCLIGGVLGLWGAI